MTTISVVAEKLLDYMEERKMNQYKLYKKSNVPTSTIDNIISQNNKSINLSTLLKLLRALEVEPEIFFADPLFKSEDLELE